MEIHFNMGQQSVINEAILQEVIGYLESGALNNTGLSRNAISLIIDSTYKEMQQIYSIMQQNKGTINE